MKIETWLKGAVKTLEAAGIGTARLDCLVLLEDTTSKDRGWLLAHPEFELSISQVKRLDGSIKRRAEHEPLAYIRGHTEFYGRQFYIDYRVLEPRPESETMVELLLKVKNKEALIIDVGTGSGALAITAKLEFPEARVIATDIDENCLKVAKKNTKKFHADIEFLQGNLLDPIQNTRFDARNTFLLCNLPYVPDNFKINPAAMREPRLAIFGGGDGLDLYRKLFAQIKKLKFKPCYVLTESMPPQHKKLEQIAKAAGYNLKRADDFIQVFEPANS